MAAKKPNIIFFFTDDQRFDTIHALGNEHIITPALDSLVAKGTTFTNAYIMGGSCPAVCMPSRAMLLTGRSLYRIQEQGQDVPEAHVLLGEALRNAGYRTFGTGKWHNGPAAYARSFTDGAEIFFGGMGDHWNVPACDFDPAGQYDKQCPECVNPGHSKELRWRKCDHVTAGKHSSELFCDATIDFLENHDSEAPFFAYVSFMAPHDPRTMPKEYQEMYDPEKIPLPENFLGAHPFDNGELKIRDEVLEDWPRTPEAIRQHIADYYAMITHADAQIGRVLEALEKMGRADDTIVVFSGDNGLAVGQHGLMGKQNMYEHSVHVPLIMCGPGVPAGERREAFCYLMDIYPTLCGLADVPTPDSVEGQSLVSLMEDPAARLRDSLFFAYRDVQRSVRDKRFKLIEYVVNGRRATQLFDLQEDPFETTNLAGDPAHAAQRDALQAELQRLRDEYDTGEQGQRFWGDHGSCTSG